MITAQLPAKVVQLAGCIAEAMLDLNDPELSESERTATIDYIRTTRREIDKIVSDTVDNRIQQWVKEIQA